jgi:hypothetical protein
VCAAVGTGLSDGLLRAEGEGAGQGHMATCSNNDPGREGVRWKYLHHGIMVLGGVLSFD